MGAHMMRVRVATAGWNGSPGLNTFYFKAGPSEVPSEPSSTEVALCLTRVHAAFQVMNTGFPVPWTATVDPQVDVLDAEDGALVNSIGGTPPDVIHGTSSVGFGPTAVATLWQLRTSTFSDGSRIRGRAFIGPWGPFAGADGSPDDALLGLTRDGAAALVDAGLTGVPVLCVWRRPRAADPEHLPHPVTARIGEAANVTSVTVPDKFAILRSRRD